jgi:hypothetical protein
MPVLCIYLNLQRIADSDFLINIFKSKNRQSWSFQKNLKNRWFSWNIEQVSELVAK